MILLSFSLESFLKRIVLDLHLNNIGCQWSLPASGLNECRSLLNPVDQTASFPPYLVPAISIAEYLAKAKPRLSIEAESPLLKILDFGGCTLFFSLHYAVTNLSFFSISAGRSSIMLGDTLHIVTSQKSTCNTFSISTLTSQKSTCNKFSISILTSNKSKEHM